jgi:hypothetical protein
MGRLDRCNETHAKALRRKERGEGSMKARREQRRRVGRGRFGEREGGLRRIGRIGDGIDAGVMGGNSLVRSALCKSRIVPAPCVRSAGGFRFRAVLSRVKTPLVQFLPFMFSVVPLNCCRSGGMTLAFSLTNISYVYFASGTPLSKYLRPQTA